MSYFSRLTDIVTCNLSEILSQESDPQSAIREILLEMEEGQAGAQRAVKTARASVERIRTEIEEIHTDANRWTEKARTALTAGDENQARLALLRKQESKDVIAGLEQQQQAAQATVDHLSTTLRALEARLSDGQRKLQEMESATGSESEPTSSLPTSSDMPFENHPRFEQIEAELDALKRELKGG